MHKKIILAVSAMALGLGSIWFLKGAGEDSSPATASTKSARTPSVVFKKSEDSRKSSSLKPKNSLPLLRFNAGSGEELVYFFDIESSAKIDIGFLAPSGIPTMNDESSISTLSSRGFGELHLRPYPAESGNETHWSVAARIVAPEYSVNGQSQPYSQAMGYPFSFKMGDSGFLSGFEFAKGTDAEAVKFVRNLMQMLQTSLPSEPKTPWRMEEIDGTGRYRAEYAISDWDAVGREAEIKKRKIDYITTDVAKSEINRNAAATICIIESSKASIRLSADAPWISSFESEETLTFKSGGKTWSNGTTRLLAYRIPMEASAGFPNAFSEFSNQLRSDKYLAQKSMNIEPKEDARSEGLDLKGALDLFEDLNLAEGGRNKREAEKFLLNYLRRHPEASFDLVKVLDLNDKARFDESTQLILWRLLAEAGHKEAQRAVTAAATESGFTELSQFRALAYLHDFKRPEQETVDKLWKLHNQLNATGGETEQELKAMSLYALGAMGSEDKLNSAIKEDVGRKLSAKLMENQDDPGESATTLAAIGNHGGEEFLPAIDPFFFSENEYVRAAAFDAMRRMEEPQTIEAFDRHFQEETSPTVRVSALKTLAVMPPSEEGVHWAQVMLSVVEEPKEQASLVDLLGKTLEDYPENEDVLRGLLASNPSLKVKKQVYKYIKPR